MVIHSGFSPLVNPFMGSDFCIMPAANAEETVRKEVMKERLAIRAVRIGVGKEIKDESVPEE